MRTKCICSHSMILGKALIYIGLIRNWLVVLNNLIYLMRTNTIIKELYLIRGREVGYGKFKNKRNQKGRIGRWN